MTIRKSVKATGVEKTPDSLPGGYRHRVHRSKKGREKAVTRKKIERQMVREKKAKIEEKYQSYERKRT